MTSYPTTLHGHEEAGRHSAFAAALLSLIFPGLGHAYLRRFRRALAWAALPILGLVLLGAVLLSKTARDGLLAQFASPSWLLAALIFNALLLVYRAFAVIDAYRLAARGGRSTGRRNGNARAFSVAGLVAVLLVLSMAHVAVGRLNLAAYQTVTGLGGGDDSDIGSEEPIGSGLVTLPPEPSASTGESASGGTSPGATPAVTDSPLPLPTQGPPWDGKERLNILLIGADHRPGDAGGGYLTDTMIVASVDPQTRQVSMFSLPRDTTRVPLPSEWPASRRYGGAYPNKINTLYTIARHAPGAFPGNDAQRGFLALKGALGELYGLDIKYYVAVDFQGFLDVVDALGGVTIDVQVPVSDYHYPADDGRGSLNLYIHPGIQHFDGPDALAYARARHATSDFDRAQRQQRVITSIRNQTDLSTLLAPGRIEALFGALRKTVKTDIPPELFPNLVSLIQSLNLNELRSVVFTPPRYSSICYPCPGTGLYELVPNVAAIRQGVKQALTADPALAAQRQKIASEAASVVVLQGSETQGQGAQIAGYLQGQGLDAAVGEANGGRADRTDYQQTIVRAYNGAEDEMPQTAKLLGDLFGTKVEPVSDATQTANFVVITGSLTPALTPPP